MDLNLREGIHLQEAIHTAKEIDQKSKLSGFNQAALDQIALQGYANAQFEVDGEEGLDKIEEFYPEENESQQQVQDLLKMQDIQKGLQQSVQALN